MGLQSWPKDQIRQADALIAKNYLAPAELKELNRLTDILLSIFEDQLEIGRLVMMEQASQLLDQQLASLNRVVLSHGGAIRHEEAEARAKAEYKRFDDARRLARQEAADRELSELKAAGKALPKPRRGGELIVPGTIGFHPPKTLTPTLNGRPDALYFPAP